MLVLAAGLTSCGEGGGAGPADGGDDPGAVTGTTVVRWLDLGGDVLSDGGADAVLVTDSSPGGARHVLVDAGSGRGVLGPGFVADRLAALGVDTLEALVLTHPDPDHVRGVPLLLERLVVRNAYVNGQRTGAVLWAQVESALRAEVGDPIVVDELIDFELGLEGDTNVQLVPPLADHLDDVAATDDQLDEGSLAVRVEREGFVVWLAGDGGPRAHERWRTAFGARSRDIDAVHVADHGSAALFAGSGSDASAWYAHAGPSVHVISAGGFRGPSGAAVAFLLGRSGTATWCSHVHGEVVLRITRGGGSVAPARNANAPCSPGVVQGQATNPPGRGGYPEGPVRSPYPSGVPR